MNILAICGSLAETSVNLRFLNALAEHVKGQHHIDIVTLHGIPMYDPNGADRPASVEELCRKITASDRVIIATPEYNYSIPGVLKNSLDWVSRHEDLPFARKKTAIMGASPGKIGTARAQYHLRQVGVFLDIDFLNKPEVMIGECHSKIDESGRITDPATEQILLKMVEKLVG